MGKIVNFTPRGTTDPDQFLEQFKNTMREIVVIGMDKDGMFVYGSTGVKVRDAIYMAELLKHHLLSDYDEE